MPLPVHNAKGVRPLQKLKTLWIFSLSAPLWAYLSLCKVKLVSIRLGFCYGLDAAESIKQMLPDILDVIRGPQLLELEYQRYPPSPAVADPVFSNTLSAQS
jgi:hypothetical protein